jgi:hypothetical protein
MLFKKVIRIVLTTLLFFQAISGVTGGALLIIDPSGELISLPLSFLEKSPFNNYLIPGLILFSALGIFPVIVLFGFLNFKNWSSMASIGIGVLLIIWIFVEILMIGYKSEPPLQLIYGIVGILITIFSLINYSLKD